MLEENGSIEELDLSWTGLSGRAAARLCAGLCQTPSLQIVRLVWCGFGDEASCEVPPRPAPCPDHTRTLHAPCHTLYIVVI